MQTRPQRDGLHRRLLRHAALLAVAPLASPEDETCTASASTSRKITLPPLALRPALPDPSDAPSRPRLLRRLRPAPQAISRRCTFPPRTLARVRGGDPWAVPTFTDRSIDG